MQQEFMGSSDRITATQAAELLGVSRKQVQRFVRQGMLRPHYERGHGLNAAMAFEREEIAALVEVREQDSFDVRIVAAMAGQAFARVRQLERRVEMLEYALGRKALGLPLDEERAVEVYARAVCELEKPRIDIDGVMWWADVFIAMGEEFLDVLEAYTNDESCWRPFDELGQIMVIYADYDRLAYDIELKTAYSYLDVGRRNLLNAAFIYTRNRFGGQVANDIFHSPDEAHAQILSILAMK